MFFNTRQIHKQGKSLTAVWFTQQTCKVNTKMFTSSACNLYRLRRPLSKTLLRYFGMRTPAYGAMTTSKSLS